MDVGFGTLVVYAIYSLCFLKGKKNTHRKGGRERKPFISPSQIYYSFSGTGTCCRYFSVEVNRDYGGEILKQVTLPSDV